MPRAVRGVSAPSRLGLLGVALIGTSLALLGYVVTATGAIDAVGARWELTRSSPRAYGAQIYETSCSVCHGSSTGGDITDYPPKHNANGHTWQHADCELLAVIRTGQGPLTESMRRSTPPPGALSMPAFRDRLSDAEIVDTIAYIKTMWTPEERASQERVTRERCGAAP